MLLVVSPPPSRPDSIAEVDFRDSVITVFLEHFVAQKSEGGHFGISLGVERVRRLGIAVEVTLQSCREACWFTFSVGLLN